MHLKIVFRCCMLKVCSDILFRDDHAVYYGMMLCRVRGDEVIWHLRCAMRWRRYGRSSRPIRLSASTSGRATRTNGNYGELHGGRSRQHRLCWQPGATCSDDNQLPVDITQEGKIIRDLTSIRLNTQRFLQQPRLRRYILYQKTYLTHMQDISRPKGSLCLLIQGVMNDKLQNIVSGIAKVERAGIDIGKENFISVTLV